MNVRKTTVNADDSASSHTSGSSPLLRQGGSRRSGEGQRGIKVMVLGVFLITGLTLNARAQNAVLRRLQASPSPQSGLVEPSPLARANPEALMEDDVPSAEPSAEKPSPDRPASTTAPTSEPDDEDSPIPSSKPTGVPATNAEPVLEFLVGAQSLIIRSGPGVMPKIVSLRHPSRLQIDFPGTSAELGALAFATGEVSRYEVYHVGGHSRVILYLRHPLKDKPVVRQIADRVVISLIPSKAPTLGQVMQGAPEGLTSPKPHMTPVPTPTPVPPPTPAPTPTPRITPVPLDPNKVPVQRDIPPIQSPRKEGGK